MYNLCGMYKLITSWWQVIKSYNYLTINTFIVDPIIQDSDTMLC